ncbi:hypothetical protein G4V62_16845 [Bacillaceae bacterium SIJ1]|uniref:hypothetical protein n=1 Tax=Litoribacterium kuwaitense TaxID=1398745 RepID=UPI0013EAA4BF|nr:hypothetical protein [Litoribacterium kuwaitense]NGP46533.1 hypothetical protein [Litoribacterium kuwaitense]
MRKYFFEALIVSALIGIFIRALVLMIVGKPLLTNIESYFYSAIIAMVSCTISFAVHVKVLTNHRYSSTVKYTISSLLILFIYIISNLFFGGVTIIFHWAFYVFALIIVLISLPLIYHLNRKTALYNEFLSLKKAQHADDES